MTSRLLFGGVAAGVVGAGLLALGVAIDPGVVPGAYLVAFGFAISTALGALAYVMIGHATGASWFVALRRFAELSALTLVPLAALFAPVVAAARSLYPWARPPESLAPALREAVEKKRAALSLPFFTARSVAFLLLWAALAALLYLGSAKADAEPESHASQRLRALSAGALPAFALTLSFATFDWFMSLEPRWTSTVYGLVWFAGGFTAAVAVVTLLAYGALRAGKLPPQVGASHFHASGRLLLTAVSLWAYLSFVQLLLQWIADKPEEIAWYHLRLSGGWRGLALALALGHFALPFLALLQRRVTRNPARLAAVSAWLLALHWVDVYWLVGPALRPSHAAPHWLHLAALLAVAGPAVAFASWRAGAASTVPTHEPELGASLRYRSP